MSDAFVLELGSVTAGIVVRQRRGVRFYASESRLYALDGKDFRSLSEARAAAASILRAHQALAQPPRRREAA